MEEVTAYKPCCCNKAMLSKSSALRHEKNCLKNPANRTCLTCQHLSFFWETAYMPFYDGVPGSNDYDYKINYCMKDGEDVPNRLSPDGEFSRPYKRNCPDWELKREVNDVF